MADDFTYISFSAEINQNTTESLLAVCADLAKKQTGTVYVLFSSMGGSVANGFTIYNVLRSMPKAGRFGAHDSIKLLGLQGRYKGLEAGPVLKLRPADPIIQVDVLLSNGPSFFLNEFSGVFDLAGGGFVMLVFIGLVGGLPRIDGASHLNSPSSSWFVDPSRRSIPLARPQPRR